MDMMKFTCRIIQNVAGRLSSLCSFDDREKIVILKELKSEFCEEVDCMIERLDGSLEGVNTNSRKN